MVLYEQKIYTNYTKLYFIILKQNNKDITNDIFIECGQYPYKKASYLMQLSNLNQI